MGWGKNDLAVRKIVIENLVSLQNLETKMIRMFLCQGVSAPCQGVSAPVSVSASSFIIP